MMNILQILPGTFIDVLVSPQLSGEYVFETDLDQNGKKPTLLFTENETNFKKLWGMDNQSPYVKDAFHRYIIDGG